MNDRLTVVVVTHDSAGALPALALALRGELDSGDELVVVDNASHDRTAALVRELTPHATLIEAGVNRGFAAGARLGVSATDAPLVLFLNPDARPQPGCFATLRAVASDRPEWGAWQPAVMLPDGRINAAGGVVHFIGVGWAGDCESPASMLADAPYETTFASGAALMIRREAWERVGGFDDRYFLYGEDLDLGLRLWLSGTRVGVEPRARVVHDYAFDKGATKWFLLERNRWRTLLTVYPAALLALIAPALAAAEVGLLLVAARDGWLVPKVRAQLATLGGLAASRRRRRAVQESRRMTPSAFAALLTASLDNPHLGVLPAPVKRAQAIYWRAVRLLLRAGGGVPC